MIETGEQLRAYYGPPSTLGVKKDMRHIDRHARAFIEQSPFVIVSSSSPEGWPEASPRGDAPGFVAVEGAHRLCRTGQETIGCIACRTS